jgi:hypothetical protein
LIARSCQRKSGAVALCVRNATAQFLIANALLATTTGGSMAKVELKFGVVQLHNDGKWHACCKLAGSDKMWLSPIAHDEKGDAIKEMDTKETVVSMVLSKLDYDVTKMDIV